MLHSSPFIGIHSSLTRTALIEKRKIDCYLDAIWCCWYRMWMCERDLKVFMRKLLSIKERSCWVLWSPMITQLIKKSPFEIYWTFISRWSWMSQPSKVGKIQWTFSFSMQQMRIEAAASEIEKFSALTSFTYSRFA